MSSRCPADVLDRPADPVSSRNFHPCDGLMRRRRVDAPPGANGLAPDPRAITAGRLHLSRLGSGSRPGPGPAASRPMRRISRRRLSRTLTSRRRSVAEAGDVKSALIYRLTVKTRPVN